MLLEAIRSGSWLTRERLRVYPLLFGAGLGAAIFALVATRAGMLDHAGRPLGTDFSQVWIAGGEIWAGHPAQPYDNAAHAAAQTAVFGTVDGYYSWPYPPYFLAVAALAAPLPYLWALGLWQGSTILAYLAAVFRAGRVSPAARGAALGLALGFPAVAINLMHGHNGFLTAGLLTGGALLLPHRPILAGALLGLLAYKPQFALAVPVALVAGGHWRGAAAAAATVVAATAATVAAFGLEPWHGFVASLAFTRRVVLEEGGPGFAKMQSAFAAVRLLGGPVSLAYGVQAAVTSGTLAALAWLWRSEADGRFKLAALLTASLLTTPYCMDYDTVLLGPALAALASVGSERGFGPYAKTSLAVAWVMPLLARPSAGVLGVPLGVAVMLILFWHTIAQARAALRDAHCRKNNTLLAA